MAERRRGPFLALVSANSQLADTVTPKQNRIFEKLQELYGKGTTFDDMVGFVGDLSGWHVFKARPSAKPNETNKRSRYLYLELTEAELHHGFQFLLTGILPSITTRPDAMSEDLVTRLSPRHRPNRSALSLSQRSADRTRAVV